PRASCRSWRRAWSRNTRRRVQPPSSVRPSRHTSNEVCSPPMSEAPRRSERLLARERREVRKEVLVSPWPDLGLVALDGPNDPEPELVVEDGRVVRIDGRGLDEFDLIDHFLARHGFDLDAAEEAARLTDDDLARRLVDVDVRRDELVRLSRG